MWIGPLPRIGNPQDIRLSESYYPAKPWNHRRIRRAVRYLDGPITSCHIAPIPRLLGDGIVLPKIRDAQFLGRLQKLLRFVLDARWIGRTVRFALNEVTLDRTTLVPHGSDIIEGEQMPPNPLSSGV